MPKTIKLSGVVGYEITAKGLENKLIKNEKNTVYVDSVGGSVFEGNRLYNLLGDKLKDGYDIDIVLGAVAASAASYFPLAVGTDRIKVRDNTVFMGHRAWGLSIGNADEMRTEAEVLDGFDKMIAKVYSKVNGLSLDENLDAMGKEFWLMGGQSVVDAGFASGIVESVDDDEESEPEDGKEKSEIQAMIKEAKAVLKEKGQEEDLEKWAAKLKEPVVNEEGQIEMFQNKEQSTPAESPGRNMSKETDMTFDEYLNQNPEHKTEFENKLNAYADEKVNAAVSEDRERTAKIAKLYGNGEMAINAMKEGTSVGDLAVAEKEKAIEASKKADESGENDLGKVIVKNQIPEGKKPEKDQKAEAVKTSVSDYLKKGVK